MKQNEALDFIVIGAGIAGLSAAAELAEHAKVLVLEREQHPGYHATGRSAAYFAPAYGNETVRALSAACEGFFTTPPNTFTNVPLMRPRQVIFVGRHDQRDAISALAAEVEQLRLIDGAEVCSRVPILNQDYVACGLLGKSGGDLDVDALLQGYRRQLKARGGILLTATKVEAMEFEQGRWSVKTTKGSFSAPSVVNAAGAWADQVAALAGADPLNIQPKRRTAMLVDLSAEFEFADWPLVVDVDEQFYLKPNAGQLLLSPADETPSEPCDAQADEFDIAVAIDRISRATSLEVSHIKHRWAGLRSFAPDHTFVVGQDSRREGFFWLAGQGGYGVQSAPALAQLTSHLLTQSTLGGDFKDIAAYKQAVSPERFSKD